MNTFPRLFRDPAAAAAAGGGGAAAAASKINPIAAAGSALQLGLGVFQTIDGNAKMKKYMAQRKSYEIPDEVYKVLNASLSVAGGDQRVLNYETNQIDKTGATILGVASRLGADPNTLSVLFGQQMDALGAAGERDHARAMENFGRVLQAYNLLSENKAAKWKSEQDIIKDKLQAAGSEMQSGLGNISGAISGGISQTSAQKTGNLYNS